MILQAERKQPSVDTPEGSAFIEVPSVSQGKDSSILVFRTNRNFENMAYLRNVRGRKNCHKDSWPLGVHQFFDVGSSYHRDAEPKVSDCSTANRGRELGLHHRETG